MEPKYKHIIFPGDTTFIEHFEGVDYYFVRFRFDALVLRYSDKPSDYISKTFEAIEDAYNPDKPYYKENVPERRIYEKAKELAKQQESFLDMLAAKNRNKK